MSTLGDVISGIKQVLLLQSQVEALEDSIQKQTRDIRKLADDLVGVDKRLVRIEAFMEIATYRSSGGMASPLQIEK